MGLVTPLQVSGSPCAKAPPAKKDRRLEAALGLEMNLHTVAVFSLLCTRFLESPFLP